MHIRLPRRARTLVSAKWTTRPRSHPDVHHNDRGQSCRPAAFRIRTDRPSSGLHAHPTWRPFECYESGASRTLQDLYTRWLQPSRYSVAAEIGRVTRHAGNREHPQNGWPACTPRFAIRIFIIDPHPGHVGDPSEETIDFGLGNRVFSEWFSSVCFRLRSRIRDSSPSPSISSILHERANCFASCVNMPDVTTYPPVARDAAIIPYNSRITVTPTLRARHCLH